MALINDERFTKIVRKHLKYMKDGERLDPDADLRSLGLDSLAALTLLFGLEEELGVTLPDDLMVEHTFSTSGALAGAFDAALRR